MNHLLFCCCCESLKGKLVAFSGQKLHKWPGKLPLCVCHWWIPSRLSPGGWEGYFPVLVWLQKKSLVKCPENVYSCKAEFHEYLADLKSQVITMVPWSDDQHHRGALSHLLLQTLLFPLQHQSPFSLLLSNTYLWPVFPQAANQAYALEMHQFLHCLILHFS